MGSFVVESFGVESLSLHSCCGICGVEYSLWKLRFGPFVVDSSLRNIRCRIFVVEALSWNLRC